MTTTDARDVTIAYTYDAVGRKTDAAGRPVDDRADAGRMVLRHAHQRHGLSGQLVKTVRYVGAPTEYVKEHVGYTMDYKPTSVKYTIPATETGLSRHVHLRLHLQPGRLAGHDTASGRR